MRRSVFENVWLLSVLPTHRAALVPAFFVAEVMGVALPVVLSDVRCWLLFLLQVLLLLSRIHLARLPWYLCFVLDVFPSFVARSWSVHVW